MTRINTNVSSLIAQKNLQRSTDSLGLALNRLSTGLRINTGKDDPAGLIASEALRSDITSVERAITNSQRANQLIATADSALGQVSSLLNDIRGLVTEAANTGALSEEQIAANQLQIDSSLEAIDRIAQITQFQGRRLLDGSLDFITTGVPSTVSDLQIDQANLGTAGSIAVTVNIAQAATKANIVNNGGVNFTEGAKATGTLNFVETAADQAVADFTALADANADDDQLSIKAGSQFDGIAGNAVTIEFVEDSNTTDHTANLTGNTLTITVGTQGKANGDTIALSDIFTALGSVADFADNFEVGTVDGNYTVDTDKNAAITFSGGNDAVQDVITVTAANGGTALNGTTINVMLTDTVGAGDVEAEFANGALTISLNDQYAYALSDVVTALNEQLDGQFTFTLGGTGDGNFDTTGATGPSGELDGGTANTGNGLLADLVVEISGKAGSEVFSFSAGTSLDQIVEAINLVSDSTGVEAKIENGNLSLSSSEYGSDAFVDINVIAEGAGGQFRQGLTTLRENGTDIEASVNGVKATGRGNRLSLNTSRLDLSLSVEAGSTAGFTFNITGGGALFQLGPDIVSNQQARIGIQSVSTARLGGVSGKLYELRSGGNAALDTDVTKAAKIVDETINRVTSLRGRLGAFQKTTLETNVYTLNETLANLTEAESTIRDADFAAESAALTRAQILVQSGTSVLSIANSNPQNALALLRG